MQTELDRLPTRILFGLALLASALSFIWVIAAESNFTDANWSSMNPSIPGADGIVPLLCSMVRVIFTSEGTLWLSELWLHARNSSAFADLKSS